MSTTKESSAQPRAHVVSGGWVVYDHDRGPYAIALYATAEEAARGAAQRGYGRVGFWPFGQDFSDAIAEWEVAR